MSKIIIIAGPSGVGKGTIEKELFKIGELNLSFSCSMTTREKRKFEIEGKHYYFIDKNKFETKILNEEFLEYSEHFNNYYGTLNFEVEKLIKMGRNVLIEVDTVGAINIIKKFEEGKKDNNLISIFIKPPNLNILEERIRKRDSESDESIKKRLTKAKKEIQQTKKFKFIITNSDLKNSIEEITKIIKGENYEL